MLRQEEYRHFYQKVLTGQTKDFVIGICCFSVQHLEVRAKTG
jgi:hypothetical protein